MKSLTIKSLTIRSLAIKSLTIKSPSPNHISRTKPFTAATCYHYPLRYVKGFGQACRHPVAYNGWLARGTNTAHTTVYVGKLRQFQFMAASEFIHRHQVNDETNESVVSCVYFRIYSKFRALEVGLYSIDGAYKFLCVRYFSSPAWLVYGLNPYSQVQQHINLVSPPPSSANFRDVKLSMPR